MDVIRKKTDEQGRVYYTGLLVLVIVVLTAGLCLVLLFGGLVYLIWLLAYFINILVSIF